MKYFVCSDIHGDYAAFVNALKEKHYDSSDPNHQIIVCGDCFGRASCAETDCETLYSYLLSKHHKNPPIVIRGNHEDIVYNILQRGYCTTTDIYNGEHNTIASLGHVDNATAAYTGIGVSQVSRFHPEFVTWIRTLPYYYETKNYIFVHGWLPGGDWRNADEEDWIRATWCNTKERIRTARVLEKYPEKTLVFGHFGTFILRGDKELTTWERSKIWISPDKRFIGLDNTTAYWHKIDMLVIED